MKQDLMHIIFPQISQRPLKTYKNTTKLYSFDKMPFGLLKAFLRPPLVKQQCSYCVCVTPVAVGRLQTCKGPSGSSALFWHAHLAISNPWPAVVTVPCPPHGTLLYIAFLI